MTKQAIGVLSAFASREDREVKDRDNMHHYNAGRVQEAKWRTLVVRANEISATDIDQVILPPSTNNQPKTDMDDEIPF